MGELPYRLERIKRLLHELEYEVTRGMLEREIDEHIHFRFVVPNSTDIPNGVVACEFRTRPFPHYEALWMRDYKPRLKIVGEDE
jgi:hypothetical protein